MSQKAGTRGELFNRSLDEAEIEAALERSVAKLNRFDEEFWQSSPLVRHGNGSALTASYAPVGVGAAAGVGEAGAAAAASSNGNGDGGKPWRADGDGRGITRRRTEGRTNDVSP
jgi:hypothetical protein